MAGDGDRNLINEAFDLTHLLISLAVKKMSLTPLSDKKEKKKISADIWTFFFCCCCSGVKVWRGSVGQYLVSDNVVNHPFSRAILSYVPALEVHPQQHTQQRIRCRLTVFLVSDGKLDVFQHNKLLTSISVWTTFGELAILYNCTRTASVKGSCFSSS